MALMDLTKITTPFGLLDEATQEALKAHGGPYEMYDGGDAGWQAMPDPSWVDTCVYRVKTSPPAPRDFWIWRNATGAVMGLFRKPTAPEDVHFLTGDEITHVREVLE
jgi:hypothetical protein